MDTVGAVCMDRNGQLCAGASSGGVVYKVPGRIGQVSLSCIAISLNNYCPKCTCIQSLSEKEACTCSVAPKENVMSHFFILHLGYQYQVSKPFYNGSDLCKWQMSVPNDIS